LRQRNLREETRLRFGIEPGFDLVEPQLPGRAQHTGRLAQVLALEALALRLEPYGFGEQNLGLVRSDAAGIVGVGLFHDDVELLLAHPDHGTTIFLVDRPETALFLGREQHVARDTVPATGLGLHKLLLQGHLCPAG
jgi:hypothetical protein